MKPTLIIVVPIYRSELSADEQISIERLTTLCPLPKCIVAPEGLALPPLLQTWSVEYFAPHFFQGIHSYNRLMLSAEFYQRFTQYDYMLIHQTDVFLFRNDLEQWCQQGYTYIGAPWLIKRKYKGLGRILLYLRAIPHRLQRRPFLPLDFGGKVGNGGLSLRHINDFLQVCTNQQPEIQQWLIKSQTQREYNEDCFWATRPGWRYPTYQHALTFSIDLDPADAMQQNHNQLPMGCHGWSKPAYRAFWWPYITQAIK